MAKFCGKIGFAIPTDIGNRVIEEVLTTHTYRGDLLQVQRRYENSENLHDDISLSNRISIVADAFAFQNFQYMRFVEYAGARWKITSSEVQHPRLILTVGGVYNGPQT